MKQTDTLATLAGDLEVGRTTSRQLVENCIARISDAAGEGSRVFISFDRDAALATASAMDQLRAHGAAPSPYAGIPVSIKDLFDVRGQVTRGGSKVLADAPPAAADATAVSRLRRAGFVLIGRTNMTEFAYSGLGINPHYGTPLNPWDRQNGRVPGGSSSGAAISVSDGMAYAGLGTDTGGSCRIPAAFTGLVGFKPTAHRVPLDGCLPLSPSLDSIGSMTRSVECCRIMDAILSEETLAPPELPSMRGLRFALPTNIVLDNMDDEVGAAFENAIGRLYDQGVLIERVTVPEFDRIAGMSAKGGFPAAESYAWHRRLLAKASQDYDPRVATRIIRGAEQSAVDYLDLLAQRKMLIEDATRRLAPYDALVMPTVAILPPTLKEIADDASYSRFNLLSLRNCTLINMIDGCAISLPIASSNGAPVGLMLAGLPGQDHALFSIAAAVERDLSAG